MSRAARRCAPMLVLGAILIAVMADSAEAASKRGGKGHPASTTAGATEAAGPAKTVKALVASLRRAHGAKARQKAMLGVMRKLGIAIYTRQGKALVRRASITRYAFLYDFELAPIAASRARGDRVAVADPAARLGDVGRIPRARS